MNNKESILRDLEYINGGINVIKHHTNKERFPEQYLLYDEWYNIICEVINKIEEDYNKCQEPLKNWQ